MKKREKFKVFVPRTTPKLRKLTVRGIKLDPRVGHFKATVLREDGKEIPIERGGFPLFETKEALYDWIASQARRAVVEDERRERLEEKKRKVEKLLSEGIAETLEVEEEYEPEPEIVPTEPEPVVETAPFGGTGTVSTGNEPTG